MYRGDVFLLCIVGGCNSQRGNVNLAFNGKKVPQMYIFLCSHKEQLYLPAKPKVIVNIYISTFLYPLIYCIHLKVHPCEII